MKASEELRTAVVKTHMHRCKGCREPMPVACVDPICTEGGRWVVLCIRCYEGMERAAEESW